MPTFAELYPDSYTDQPADSLPPVNPLKTLGDYSGTGEVQGPVLPPEVAAPPQRALSFADISPRPDISTPGGAIMNFLRGGNSVRDWELQKQVYEGRQQQQAAQKASTEANLFHAIYATEPGNRKPLIGTLERYWLSQGITPDPAITEFLAKAEKDDLDIARESVQLLQKEYPEIPPETLSKYLYTNPAGIGKLFKTIADIREQKAKGLKLQSEADMNNVALQMMQKELTGEGGIPAPQGIPAPPQQSPQAARPQLRPAALPLQAIQQRIVQEAEDQGVDPAFALALAHTESGFQHVAGDGGDAIGYFQLHEPAARDAGQAIGLPPEARNTPEGNIKLGVQYAKQLLQRAGSPVGAMALYNWGTPTFQGKGNPQYIQQTAPLYAQYKQMLGGRPVSQATLGAPPEYQARIAALNQVIDTLQRSQAGSTSMSLSPRTKAMWEAKDKVLKGYQTERDALVKQFEPKAADPTVQAANQLGVPVTPSQRTPQQEEAVTRLAAQNEAEAARLKEAAVSPLKIEQAAAQTEFQRLTPEENRQYGTPPGTSNKDLRQSKGKYTQTTDLSPTEREQFDKLEVVASASQKLLDTLKKDPEAVKIIGTIFSNPEGRSTQIAQKYFGGKATPAQLKLVSRVTDLRSQILAARAGLAQTKNEIENLADLLPSAQDADVNQLRAKLEALHEGVLDRHATYRINREAGGFRVPPALKPLPDAGTSEPSVPQASPAVQRVNKFLDEN